MAGRKTRARARGECRPDGPRLRLASHRFSAGAGSENSTVAWRFLHRAGRQYPSLFVPGKSTDDQYDRKAARGRVGWPGVGATLGATPPKIRQNTSLDREVLCLQRAAGQLGKLGVVRRQLLRGLR